MTYHPCSSFDRLAYARSLTWIAVGVALPFVVGCGPQTVTVSGTVQYEGKPIETGEISFTPPDGEGAPQGAVIANGKYAVDLSPGKKTVRIRASRLIPAERRDPRDPAGLREDFLPAKFNDDSTITVTIDGDPIQTRDFNL